MFEITPDAQDYIVNKGREVTVWMETHHASGG